MTPDEKKKHADAAARRKMINYIDIGINAAQQVLLRRHEVKSADAMADLMLEVETHIPLDARTAYRAWMYNMLAEVMWKKGNP